MQINETIIENKQNHLNNKSNMFSPSSLAFYNHLLKFCITNNSTPENAFNDPMEKSFSIGRAIRFLKIECEPLTFEQAKELAKTNPFTAEQIYKGFLNEI